MLRIFLFHTLLFLFVASAEANLTIEITSGVDNPTKIAVVPFKRGGQLTQTDEDLAAIVAADLKRSGQFEVLPRKAMFSTPTTAKEVYYRDWRSLGVEYVLIGRSNRDTNGVNVAYELFDVRSQRALLQRELHGSGSNPRLVAHKVSDKVYQELTGIPGAFSTQMLYVSVINAKNKTTTHRLLVADADGANPREVLKSSYPVLSPAWSPDGKQVAYVSFERDRPAIYRQVLKTGQREKLTHFKGLNSAPTWSPDGKKMAMVLSKDGNPEIYVMNLASKSLKRITNHYAIDTEPDWLPDGKSLVFTSDRGGKPQIYKVTLATGKVTRLTFKGSYNAAADVLPDGKSMVMIHKSNGDYHIAWQEFSSGRIIVLTRSFLDESPSVAPNGSMLLYATKYRGRGVLAAVALDGGFKYRLPSPNSDVREPAWSPVY